MKKPSEKDHLTEIGEDRYWRAFELAQVECRKDSHLVGLTKVRDAIAHEAALRATGFPVRPFNLPKSCGEMTADMGEVIDKLLPKAIEAATAGY